MHDLYPTRGDEEQIIDRKDPVVHENQNMERPMGDKELTFFEKNGFIMFADLFSAAEIDTFQKEFEQLKTLPSLQGGDELIREPSDNTVRSIFSPHRHSELFGELSRDERILNRVRQLLGGDVYVHHARINIKPAYNGKSFPWHSDFETWHAEDGIANMRILSAWIMLTENNPYNGPLYVIPGSHKKFVACKGRTPDGNYKNSLRKQEYGVPSKAAIQKLSKDAGLYGVYGKPGTLVIHEGNLMHGSPDNISPYSRTNLFFVYNSIDNTPLEVPFAAENFRPPFLSDRNPEALKPIQRTFT